MCGLDATHGLLFSSKKHIVQCPKVVRMFCPDFVSGFLRVSNALQVVGPGNLSRGPRSHAPFVELALQQPIHWDGLALLFRYYARCNEESD